jgi:hypothetical protein
LTCSPRSRRRVGIAGDLRTRAIDVIEDDEIALGTDVTYRVASLDVIGRRSTLIASPPLQLRKLTRPPTPIAPPPPSDLPPDLPLLAQPNGIGARLLQSDDQDLTGAERARIAAEGEVVVLRWGWGPDQRELDPHVTEFRVYDAAGRLIEILARVTAPATPTGTGSWRVPCSLSRPIAAGEFAGRSIVLGAAFRIVGHPAGAAIDIEVTPIGPAGPIPSGDNFALIRTTGAEDDPSYWDRRILTVPRTDDPADPTAVEAYEVALPADWITVDAAHPTQTHSLGVSAADDQAYIPDRLQAVEPSPRPGSESAVAHAEVVARFRARPELTIADLAAVASIVAPRAAGDAVSVTFRPADLLPAGVTAGPLTRIERCPASAILPRIVVDATSVRLRLQSGALVAWPLSAATRRRCAPASTRATPDKFLARGWRIGPPTPSGGSRTDPTPSFATPAQLAGALGLPSARARRATCRTGRCCRPSSGRRRRRRPWRPNSPLLQSRRAWRMCGCAIAAAAPRRCSLCSRTTRACGRPAPTWRPFATGPISRRSTPW